MKNEEEHHTAYAEQNYDNGQSNENGSRPERRCGDRIKIGQLSLANDILTILYHPACLPQSEMSGAPAFLCVTQPMWLDKDHDHDDGKTDGEYPPQHTDGLRIFHVIRMLEAGLRSVFVFGVHRHVYAC
ncbi:hypothetical protein AVEN_88238-1 [Araneus ventricosus]|uniref:Uncharacterized protein n=1 Tax=Araneus ventricosus TaxID=182803 RepID=A0A4Y2CKN5_ARAVE|nr:hypothetical protein AVEN_88238-1 [Araneus ventricosus]